MKDGIGLGPMISGSGRSLEFGHGGSTMGFHCTLTMYPEIGAGAVVMANGEDGVSQSIRTARAPGAQRIG